MFKPILSLFFVLLFALPGMSQTAEEIVGRHIDALGGKEKLGQLKTIHIQSDIEVMGNNAPMELHIVDGKAMKSVVNFNGSEIIQVVTDTSGWSVNPMMGSSEPTAMQKEQYEASRSQIFIAGPLFDYEARGNKVELLGKENNLYKLKVTNQTPFSSTYFIDPETYYITKAIIQGNVQGQTVEITSDFSQYRKTDIGFVMPFESNIDYGQFQIHNTVKKVDINQEVDPKIFQMAK